VVLNKYPSGEGKTGCGADLEADNCGKVELSHTWPQYFREVDIWFATEILPHESSLIRIVEKITGNAQTARDFVHEAYAELLKDGRWRAVSNPRAYVMSTVRNVALRSIQRSRIVSFKLFANMDELAVRDLAPDAYQLLSAKEKRQVVLRAIRLLPPQCRRVVKLRRLKEKSPVEIAQIMGITVSTVNKHLASGMIAIADKLREIGLDEIP